MNARGVAQIVGPLTVAVAAWFGFAAVPSALSSEAERRVAAEEDYGVLAAEVADARRRASAVPALEARRAETASAVPPTIDLPAFVRVTDEAADRTGVAIEQIAPLQVSSDTDAEAETDLPTGTSSVTISLGASGSYAQVMAFAEALRTIDRLVVLDRIDLNADEAEPGQLLLDLELRIFTADRLVTDAELALRSAPLDPSVDPSSDEDESADGPGREGTG